MKFVHKLYHFLGGIYFALILILIVTLFVIAGTFIESLTESHRYAALLTYEHPIFAALLWGFFLNIFLSTLRRWPFRWKHLPFLTTHLGLLMILAGVLSKHYFGLQGSMSLSEGTGSQEVLEAHTYAVHVEKKNESPIRYPLQKEMGGKFKSEIVKNEQGFNVRLAEYHPHCKEYLATWIKGSYATINGLQPMRVQFVEEEQPLKITGQALFHQSTWDLYAFKTCHLENTIKRLYCQNAYLKITDRITKEMIFYSPLETFLNHSLPFKEGSFLLTNLSLKFSPVDGFQHPLLSLKINTTDIAIPLNGHKALFNLNQTTPELGNIPVAIDICQQPLLAIIQDEFDDVFLIAFDSHGRVWSKPFLKGNLDSLIAYDEGFGGYTARAELPFDTFLKGRQEREDLLTYHFKHHLSKAISAQTELSPPLKLFQNACQKKGIDFPTTAARFFTHWNSLNSWLYPPHVPLPEEIQSVFSLLDWKSLPPHIFRACRWMQLLFEQLSLDLKENPDLISALRRHQWPLLPALEKEISLMDLKENPDSIYTLLTKQLFAASEILPFDHFKEEASNESMEEAATVYSAYLRAYGIHFNQMISIPSEEEMNKLFQAYQSEENLKTDIALATSSIVLETSILPFYKPVIPRKKLEDNFPKITLHVNEGTRAQSISLSYSKNGTGLKWPVLNGEYLLRFQPQFKEIPYRVRLRQARQINYPNSSQPYSFESDLIFTDLKTNVEVEKTISMNKVYETWDGYRFYLSSITPPTETEMKQIQIVVNYDPTKYGLTYPGAIILSCGIILLFIMRPYRRSKP